MLENGADIRFIQAMLCHTNIQTTEVYTQVSIKKLQQVHELTHPSTHEAPEASGEKFEAGEKPTQPEPPSTNSQDGQNAVEPKK